MKHILIGGCGRIGAELAKFKASEGYNVMVIDQDPEAFKPLGANIATIEGSLLNTEVLKQAGDADEVYVLTGNNNINLAVALIIEKLLKKKATIKIDIPHMLPWVKKYNFPIINGTQLVMRHMGCTVCGSEGNGSAFEFPDTNKGDHILIIGGGEKAVDLCHDLESFLEDGSYTASVIETDSAVATQLARSMPELEVYIGDGSDIDMQITAGAQKASKAAALTGSDEVNLIVSWMARDIFKTPQVLARVNNPLHISAFELLGIDAVNPTREFSNIIRGNIAPEEYKVLSHLLKNEIDLVQITAEEGSEAVGKAIKEIFIHRLIDCTAGIIIRNKKAVPVTGDTRIQANDNVIVFSTPQHKPVLLEIFSKRD